MSFLKTPSWWRSICFAALFAGVASASAQTVALPYESSAENPTSSSIDSAVLGRLHAKGLQLANLCSDEVFVRRVYVDLLGKLPQPDEVRSFLQTTAANKRATLIDQLLDRDEFAVYQAMKWGDILRIKSEFPINLWPNAVQAYHAWIQDSFRENRPYDQFARALLVSSGSNFRVPPVNFYRAVQGRSPDNLAQAAALTFMGTRLEKWPTAEKRELAKLFSRVRYKETGEWKEEIVFPDPASTTSLSVTLPGGNKVVIAPDTDPREIFAKWLLSPGNPWFARSVSNRVWSWIFGRGIVQEPDDIRADNPPSNPELLASLEKELVNVKYDPRAFYRVILNTRTYQQSSIPQTKTPEAEALFACYPVRRLEAEVLIDALNNLTGGSEGYSSPIPEPFTFIPDNYPTVGLPDGSIGNSVLELFGRPARDSGLEAERNNKPTEGQRLHLLNSSHVQKKITQSSRLQKLVASSKGDRRELVKLIYLAVLSRYPTNEELTTIQEYVRNQRSQPKQALDDLVWALVNSKEFLYRH